ncbi:PREDICTED: peptidase M20 domain-containing protein 2-like isoform X1 [Priapulus caudatus]|uniref:Peptidase M20 domain-containing protein 2 n=1 Tax=Priapulus caudatus TaxID=37621 RepID=A0ABM1EC43_PRICU|nr:PREDICTED: peptidase M20 domain-containing protein 2-like isoform X1 [Priapulus caudatus]
MSLKEGIKVASQCIDAERENLKALSLELWNNPELGFEEIRAHKLATDFLEQRGFKVERAYHMPTAFRAEFTNGDGPNICIICEYDALPEIGHACGHNLICEAGIAASIAVKSALEANHVHGKLTVLGTPAEEGGGAKVSFVDKGVFGNIEVAMMVHPYAFNRTFQVYLGFQELTVMGTPAEEGGGGKVMLINAAAFSDVDLSMMVHPFARNDVNISWLGIQRLIVTYTGKAAHAAASPWDGINALDAAVACYNGLSMLRQQMKPSCRIHAVITKGGVRPNIIPAEAEVQIYVRATEQEELKLLLERVSHCIVGAGKMTGCDTEFQYAPNPYAAVKHNHTMGLLYEKYAREQGIEFPIAPNPLPGGSTDMGNVSHVVPSIHPTFYIGTNSQIHTKVFREQAGTDEAQQYTLVAAKSMAFTTLEVLSDPALLSQIKKEFEK